MIAEKEKELIVFLVKNSVQVKKLDTLEDKKRSFEEWGRSCNKKYWAMVDAYVPHFLCPLVKLEEFLGEEYDYTKHIKPLMDAGYIWRHEWVNCFPHSEELAKQSLKKEGIVSDESGLYFQFHFGSVDPNSDPSFKESNIWV